MASSSSTNTTLLLSNLHCPSCVSNIETTLYALSPKPSSVSPSILTSLVTVRHHRSLQIRSIRGALEDSGFQICSITQDGLTQELPIPSSRSSSFDPIEHYLSISPSGRKRDKSLTEKAIAQKHLQDCTQCRDEQQHRTNLLIPALSQYILKDSALADVEEIQHEDKEESSKWKARRLSPMSGTTINTANLKQVWRASLAVNGMTCASCAKSITDELTKIGWIEHVAVNLIGNSASVVFSDKEKESAISGAIEDIGFDACLVEVVEVVEHREKEVDRQRTIEIQVDGMFCSHCPEKLHKALDHFEDVRVERRLTVKEPVLKITYLPQTPKTTIRTIMAKLMEVDSQFKISVFHPPTLEERSQRMHALERQRILARVVLSVATGIPTFIIGVVFMSLLSESSPAKMYLMHPLAAGVSRSQWALFIMATPVYFFAADIFHRRAIKEVYMLWKPSSKTPFLQRFYRFGSMNMLMSLGTSVSYVASVGQLIAAGINKTSAADDRSFYFDSVVFLTMFLLIGRLIEAYSKSRTGDAVAMLGKLRPTEALLISTGSDDGPILVNVDLLELDDVIRIVHGSAPPCDGVVIDGSTIFDESSLTGESKPVKKTLEDQVFAGTINKGAAILMRITGVAGSSMLDQIVSAVREGQTRRAPIERIADGLTSYFVPVITLLAISTWVIWLSLGLSGVLPDSYLESGNNWTVWSLQFAIAVFVVACPCGLALAAPTAIFVGGGLAAQHGILVKGGGEAFEKASRLDCVVFDKTGTLTLGGEPAVTEHEFCLIESEKPSPPREAMIGGIVRAIEEESSHPIAKAIVTFCKTQEYRAVGVDDIEELPGRGLKGKFTTSEKGSTIEVIIGNEALMTEYGVRITTSTLANLNSWKAQGKSVALVATRTTKNYHLRLTMAISDPIRPEAPSVIRALKSRGMAVWMLSGDNKVTATAVGARIGIPASNIISGVLPSQKAERILWLQKTVMAGYNRKKGMVSVDSHRRALVAMVGDGINDSPALTTADVGIAIGSGSDIAISSAEFVLISSSLHSLVTLLDLSRTVFRRVKFNFAWALVYNMVAVPVAAGAFYAIKTSGGEHVRLDPAWASLAMAMSSISVVVSSLALRIRAGGVGFRARKSEVCEGV